MENDEQKIDAKIGTEEDSLWMRVKENTEQRIKQLKDDLVLNEEVLKLAESKLTDLLIL